MIKTTNKISDIKNSNLVYLVEKQADLKQLDVLKLDKKIIEKIISTLKKEESIKLDFFIGNAHFENLHILYFSKKDNKKLTEFLGKVCPTLPDHITLQANSDANIITLVHTCILSRYSFDVYKTEKNKKKTIIFCDKKQNKIIEAELELIENISLARDLGETPACDLTPENFAKQVKNTKWKHTKVKILSPKEVEKKGLGLLFAVGKASVNKPYMVILERIVDKNAPTYGLVGKGIVFDSGGLDIKPTDHMYEMKGDMCGAAAAFATMKELDTKTDLKINIVTCLVLAENAVSGEAYRPSDILTSYSGKTVNVTNTDAEGRLVLGDGISYISKNYKLNNIITIATLTGAVMVAYGYRYAGIMGTDRATINTLLKNSKDGEKYCELPFDDYFVEKCKSDIADLDNWTKGIYAGSTMGAAFLSHFLMNNEKYTHLDIAGTAINSYEPYEHVNKGMTGFGVESLSKFFLGL